MQQTPIEVIYQMNSRCPKCFNTIPEWANGVCPVCTRIKKDNQRFRTKHKSARKKYKKKPRTKSDNNKSIKSKNSVKTKSVKSIRKKKSREYPQSEKQKALKQLDGFNRLHWKIFQERRYFRDILLSQNIPKHKIEAISKNTSMFKSFMNNFSRKFAKEISSISSNVDYQIIEMYFGLDGYQAINDHLIARKIEFKYLPVTPRRKRIMNHLSSDLGRRRYSKLVLTSYKEIERNFNI